MDHEACATYFTPSLWKQRRSFILNVLKNHKVQKVLDYGCGEGAVLSFLIPPSVTDDIHFTHLTGLDIDRDLLEKETLAACKPWPSDYEQLRESPLTVDIYCGSVGEYDDRLRVSNCDAIICTEVIEHVYPSTLEACLPMMLGAYAPPLVIVTTPNAEYNVFFPDLKYGQPDATFRHDDHKFEWTRHEFEEWCRKGAQLYGYDVEFHGIGLLDGQHDRLEYGHCTQACIFTKQQPHHPGSIPSQQTTKLSHVLLKRYDFPYYDLPSLPVQAIFQQVESHISSLCQAATLKQLQEEKQQQSAKQIVSMKGDNDGDDDGDDGLDALITWSTDTCNFDDGNKVMDWKQDVEDGCTTNNQTWCTNDADVEHDDNKHYHWEPEMNDDGSNGSILSQGEEEHQPLWNDDDYDDEDGNSSNDSILSNDNDECQPLWTTTPITLDLDTLWSILHIRQLCKTRQRFVEAVLPIGDDASYKIMGDQLVVHKSFMVTR